MRERPKDRRRWRGRFTAMTRESQKVLQFSAILPGEERSRAPACLSGNFTGDNPVPGVGLGTKSETGSLLASEASPAAGPSSALSPSAGRAKRVPEREALGVGPQRTDG